MILSTYTLESPPQWLRVGTGTQLTWTIYFLGFFNVIWTAKIAFLVSYLSNELIWRWKLHVNTKKPIHLFSLREDKSEFVWKKLWFKFLFSKVLNISPKYWWSLALQNHYNHDVVNKGKRLKKMDLKTRSEETILQNIMVFWTSFM